MAKTIADYQADYNRKGATQAEKDAAHSGAESIRAKSGYSGGADGSQKISLSKSGSSVESKNNKTYNGKPVTVTKDGKTGKAGYVGVGGYKSLEEIDKDYKNKSYSYYRNSDGTYTAYEANQKSKNYNPSSTVKAFMDDTGYKPFSGKYSDYLAKGGTSNDWSETDKAGLAGLQSQFKVATTELEKQFLNRKANELRAKYGQAGQVYKPVTADNSAPDSYTGGDVMPNEQIPASAPVSATASAPADMADGYDSIQERQDYLLKQKKRVEVDRLRNQLRQAENEFDSQENKIAPKFLQQKTNLNVSSQLQRRSFDEFLASRNMLNSGSAAQGEIARNVATQQGLTDIGTAESNAYADIADRRTQANLAYDYGVTNAENDLSTQQAQAEINALLQQQSAYESAQAKQAEYEFEMQKAAQEQANKIAIEEIKLKVQEALKAGDQQRAIELAKYKNDLENEQIKLRASTRTPSGGSPTTGGKVSESQLNTLEQNFGKMVLNNPNYTAYNDTQKQAFLQKWKDIVNSKIDTGAIDPATGEALKRYALQQPEYIEHFGITW